MSAVAARVLSSASFATSSATGTHSNRMPDAVSKFSLVSSVKGAPISQRQVSAPVGKVQTRRVATSAVATVPTPTSTIDYTLPSWTEFECGLKPVFWDTADGLAPASGKTVTVYFNPSATDLIPNPEYGVGFNGGFNSPFMCAGEPRVMSRKERGPSCHPFFTIRINMPMHAKYLEFSFTDGDLWNGPYILDLTTPISFEGKPDAFFNEGLKTELELDGACDGAIYPDAAYVPTRCILPYGTSFSTGQSCELDLVPGCTDPESPSFDPLATHDDGSCPMEPEQKN